MDTKIPADLIDKKILVADDQGSIRSVFKLVLQDMGFEDVTCAIDGAEAIQLLRTKLFDLVICDWQMPKMSGLDVLHQVRACEATTTLPFMMVTSSSETNNVKSALQVGVSDYLIKPFQPGHLSKKTIDLLRTSTHTRALLEINLDESDNSATPEESTARK